MTEPIDVERLARCLWHVTADRGYIDLGGMDLAFGGAKPFMEIAEAIAVYYNGSDASRGYERGYIRP